MKLFFSFLPHNLRPWLCLGAVAVLAVPVEAATVVNFDGVANDYVAGISRTIPLGTPTQPNANDYVYGYSSTRKSPSSTVYSGPEFFGGAWMSSSNGSVAGFSSNRVRANYANTTTGVTYKAQIEVSLTGHAGVTASGGMLTAFSTASPTETFSISSTSTLSMEISTGSQTEVRFAILSGSQWYLSAASVLPISTTGGLLTLGAGDLASSLWAVWDPVGGADGRLGSVPTEFTVAGNSLTDIQAVGYYTDFKASTSNQYAYIGKFSADFEPTAVPEPSVTMLFGLGAMLIPFWVWKRRKHAEAV